MNTTAMKVFDWFMFNIMPYVAIAILIAVVAILSVLLVDMAFHRK